MTKRTGSFITFSEKKGNLTVHIEIEPTYIEGKIRKTINK